ncbi:hypothetical protein JNUCC0626_30075 [Lentzea sp. JNUCC 0626]|uniref:hypothetical protein n=1 Tax=Lentzea sp. JNUCC 0626 TaxID=3367513 RepID=UPI00374A7103
MKRFLPVLGALVLLVAIVGAVVWQRPDSSPEAIAAGDVVVQHADGSLLWRSGQPETPLVGQVLRELVAVGTPLDRLREAGGALVVTTIDAKAQTGATEVVRQLTSGRPASITAIDPSTGGVRAYVPGTDPAADYAGGVVREAGAAARPFGSVVLMRAAGVPERAQVDGRDTELLGTEAALLRPLDVATAYATVGADGVHHATHFVTHVTEAGGNTLYRAATGGKPALGTDPGRSKEFAARVNEELRADPLCGNTPDAACLPVEVKDGDVVRHAWMIGYTPRLAVVVFVGGESRPDVQGRPVTGTGLPNDVLLAFQEKLMAW